MHRVREVTAGATSKYYLGGSIEPPEPPLATGLYICAPVDIESSPSASMYITKMLFALCAVDG